MKLLLYCTKAKPFLREYPFSIKERFYQLTEDNFNAINGKIVAECDFEVEKLSIGYGVGWQTETIKGIENIEKLSCLSRLKLYEYCKGKGYAIHIKNLHIFDEPKELNEVYSIKDIGGGLLATDSLKKAPQNMMRVSVNKWDYGRANFDDICIVISIRPEWLCKILNGEKTIEVRRKVLKEVLKND